MNAFPAVARLQEEHGRRGLLRAVVGSRHLFDGSHIEVRRGRADDAACLTCGLRGTVSAVLEHDVGQGAHVWAMVVDGGLVQDA